jgi:hypothetical protein
MIEALRCVTPASFGVIEKAPFRPDRTYAATLNKGMAVRLAGTTPILLIATQNFRIVRADDERRGPYKVTTTQYFYQLRTLDDVDIVGFHWTPNINRGGEVGWPHLHAGPALVRADSPVAPKTAHKLHIPTGRVALESVLRFMIEELGVKPARNDWDAVLARTQTAFETWRTRSS